MYGEGNLETPWEDSVPICHVYREYSGRNAALTKKDAMNPCTGSRFPSSTSRGLGKSERILQIRKKASQPIKNTDTIPCSMSPHSRTTSSRWLQDFPVCSALTPDSERPAILSGTDLYPCFCAVFFITKKPGASPQANDCSICMISSKRSIGLASRFRP